MSFGRNQNPIWPNWAVEDDDNNDNNNKPVWPTWAARKLFDEPRRRVHYCLKRFARTLTCANLFC
jgi:hypothetical protein